jgi:hypothetical protein
MKVIKKDQGYVGRPVTLRNTIIRMRWSKIVNKIIKLKSGVQAFCSIVQNKIK